MADGCILFVDAFEGPMPQTRFVLQKALQIGLKPIVVVNKVDKPNCRPEEVYEMVFDLMFSLECYRGSVGLPRYLWFCEEQLDEYGLEALLLITSYPLTGLYCGEYTCPRQLEGTPQMLVTSLDYSSYTGRIAVGRVHRGTLERGDECIFGKA